MDTAIRKRVLRTFTYGMFVVSCADAGEINAFTVNWLTQVSFEPPLIAVSIENDSKSLPMILNSQKLTISVLKSGDRQLAADLGKSALKYPGKLQGIAYEIGPNGCPILKDALAWLACDVRSDTPAGDSTVVIAEATDLGMLQEGEPLTMSEAGFRHAG